jgi:hypothetical protein
MTVADNTSRNQYTATSGQTVFAYTFEIVDKDDVVVLKNGTTLSEGTDYTVSNVGNDSGGNVTLTVGATTGDILTLYRDMPYSRTQNYTNSGDFLASEVNSDFDNLWLAGEQTNRAFSQSIRKPITDSDSISMELPEAADRTDSFLTFDSTGAVSTSPLSSALSPSIIVRQQFTGNGSTTVFTLAADPGSAAAVVIYIDGVYQEEGTYSVSGTALTFTEAPPTNASIEVVSYKVSDLVATDAANVTYTPAGTGAVQTTVQTKLRESVSVKDFGAVGDGVTDDTAAIQAAVDAVVAASGGKVFVPTGKYLVSSTIDLASWYGAPAIIFEGEGYGPWNKDGVIATSEHASLFIVATDGFNVFNIASASQTVVQNISIRDTSGSRTSGAGIYLERNGDGIVSDDGTVAGVLIKQVSIKGFQDGIRAIRLQTSTIEQVVIEDCTRDGIRLEPSAVGGGTSVTLSNCFVKECGQDNYSISGMSYSALVNCGSDSSTRHTYYLDGATRDNQSISFTGCGAEGAGDDGIHITSSNFGVTIIGCGIGPTAGDGIYSAGQGITIIGGKIQTTTGFGINAASGDAITAIGATFSANTAGETNSTAKLIQIRNDEKNFMLVGHNVQTGATDSDVVLKNSSGLRSVNNAGTTSANYQIRSASTDSWIYGVPSSTADHVFAFAGTNRMQFEEENGAAVVRILGEVSADPANPAANQARLYLKDNGAGKTQLMVRFGTGAAQILATEP